MDKQCKCCGKFINDYYYYCFECNDKLKEQLNRKQFNKNSNKSQQEQSQEQKQRQKKDNDGIGIPPFIKFKTQTGVIEVNNAALINATLIIVFIAGLLIGGWLW